MFKTESIRLNTEDYYDLLTHSSSSPRYLLLPCEFQFIYYLPISSIFSGPLSSHLTLFLLVRFLFLRFILARFSLVFHNSFLVSVGLQHFLFLVDAIFFTYPYQFSCLFFTLSANGAWCSSLLICSFLSLCLFTLVYPRLFF